MSTPLTLADVWRIQEIVKDEDDAQGVYPVVAGPTFTQEDLAQSRPDFRPEQWPTVHDVLWQAVCECGFVSPLQGYRSEVEEDLAVHQAQTYHRGYALKRVKHNLDGVRS